MKSLNTIQTFSKIARIISKIIFIFSIIGGAAGALGIVCYALLCNVPQLNSQLLAYLSAESIHISVAAVYVFLGVEIVCCAAGAVTARFAQMYFKNELAAGTPFTLEGAREMLRLGIITAAVPLGTEILCAIAVGIASSFIDNLDKLELDNSFSFGLGIVFLILSVIFRYGAEIRNTEE